MTTPNLHETDFYGWCEAQIKALRSGIGIDIEHISEELQSMTSAEKRELRTRLSQLFMHLLKMIYQKSHETKSWRDSVFEQRTQIAMILEDSASLKRFFADYAVSSYALARKWAAQETGLPLKTFPLRMPFSLDQALNLEWLP